MTFLEKWLRNAKTLEWGFPRAGGFCSTRNNFVGGEHNPKCGFTLSLARSLARSVFRFPRAGGFCSTRSNFVGGEPVRQPNPICFIWLDNFFIVLQKMASPSLPTSSTVDTGLLYQLLGETRATFNRSIVQPGRPALKAQPLSRAFPPSCVGYNNSNNNNF